FAAQRLDAAADCLDHCGQSITAEMRPIVIKNGRFSLAGRKQLQDAANTRAGTAARQLAVAEGAGAALAKKIVAFGIERPAGVEGMHIVNALANGPATFEDQRPVTLFCQKV